MAKSIYPDFIWGNQAVMYSMDLIIVILAVLAVYWGGKIIRGQLGKAFVYIFAGVLFLASNYVLDAYAMLIDNMPLMAFFHNNVFWILNALALFLVTIGFYKINKLFKVDSG